MSGMEKTAGHGAGGGADDGTPEAKSPPKSGGKKGKKSKIKPENTPPAGGAAQVAAEPNPPGAAAPSPSTPGDKVTKKEKAVAKKEKADKQGQGQGEGKVVTKKEKADKQSLGQGEGQVNGEAAQAPQKTKAELKAERRAIQEAQRAAKMAKKEGAQATAAQGKAEPPRVPAKVLGDDPSTQKKHDKKLAKLNVPQRASTTKKVAFFSHLRQYDPELKFVMELPTWQCSDSGVVRGGIHPEVKTIGLKFFDYTLVGSSCRATAFLGAMQAVIQDYTTPKDKDLCRDLDAHVARCITYIDQFRPLSVSMGNAIKFLKWNISNVPPSMAESEAKKMLLNCIDTFVSEKIVKACDGIAHSAEQHIQKGDYFIVFGFSYVVMRVLTQCKHKNTLTVVVVDNRPRHEGWSMLARLMKNGIRCIFVPFNQAALYIRGLLRQDGRNHRKVKVMLGAHGVMNNGFLVSRIGAAMLAAVAKGHNLPVLVCHETYKISERSQTDSFVFNELGNPNELVRRGDQEDVLGGWQEQEGLKLLNLMYDVTANSNISFYVTETGSMSDTGIPKLLASRMVLYER